ncbi:MAG: IMP dehydrogenase [Conexivisphaerales archaeon]
MQVEKVRGRRLFRLGLTYDDVLLVPKYSDIMSRKEVDTSARLTRKISLSIPIISSNMDTVTESAMAIAMARLGGIGIIHRFLSIKDEVHEVEKVKRYEGFMIEEPITILPHATVGEAKSILSNYGIGGIIVVDDRYVVKGIVTRRDLEFEDDDTKRVNQVMTGIRKLITASPGVSLEEAKEILKKNKVEKLPLLDEKRRLKGLITAKDIMKMKMFPNATKDRKGRLRVGAAVGVKGDYIERARKLVEAACDVIVVDVAHGHSLQTIEAVKRIKRELASEDAEVVAGNVATAQGVVDLAKAGVDAVKVGVGPGSICTTRIVTGFGVPQLTAILECSRAAEEYDLPIIADGGIRFPGDITKAIAAGASTVMIGGLFAGTEESPGPTVLRNGIKYKLTRGMASLSAAIDRRMREDSNAAEQQKLIESIAEETVPEGVEGLIPYKGRVEEVVKHLVGGLRSGMSYCGAHNIKELRKKAEFVRMTSSGFRESLPHDVERVV